MTEWTEDEKRQLVEVMLSDPGRGEFDGRELLGVVEEHLGFAPDERFYFVAEVDGKIVGFVRVWHYGHC